MVNQNTSVFRKVAVWLPFLLSAVLAIGMFIGMRFEAANTKFNNEDLTAFHRSLAGQGSVEELMRYIEAKYVEEPDKDLLVRKAIESIIGELDPHSSYIPAEELVAINEQMEGNFDGIGVEFMLLDDTIVIVSPLAGGPSEAVGIRAGDKIIAIEDSIVAGKNMETQDIYKLLRGKKGTKVRVDVMRNTQKALLNFTITRDKIPVHSVDVAMMLDEKTGYINVNRFSATTYDEFVKSLETLVETHQMRDLIIDLRHNPGGYLTQATKMLGQLFPEKDKLLVYTEGRTVKRTEYKTNGRTFYNIGQVVVLIDEGSASASEIVAGAIQDHDRGVIVGRRSFGKGLVQEQYPLRDGSALRLTVARYYTPSGRCIQKNYAEKTTYEDDLEERYTNGELSEEDSMVIADSTRYFTANGHIVYGGGGIIPDYFVPLDTALVSNAYLIWRQHIPAFVIEYATKHPLANGKKEMAQFVSGFQVSAAMFNDFVRYAKAQGEQAALPTSPLIQSELKRYLKARLARQHFGQAGFYAVWNEQDAMIVQAKRLLKSNDPVAQARGK